MAGNHVLLETIVLSQSTSSVTFDNLPTSGYTDLKIVASARSDRADLSDNIIISFNGSTANLSYRYLQGSGTSAYSSTSTTGYVGTQGASTSTAKTFGNAEYYIPNYRSGDYKSVSSDSIDETNAAGAYQTLVAQLWSNTAAITSINLKPQVGSNFVTNSTFSIYGVAALGTTPAVAPKATGGNIVANDGTYWYHAFLTSGTFTPQTALSCDALVIAGGGGGGAPGTAGGAGAGGLLAFTSQSLTATNYICTVGAGGVAGALGNDSQFGALTLVKGGGYGVGSGTGATGGSGGGGGISSGAGGSPTSGQGNAGGTGFSSGTGTTRGAGGGGGSAAVGSNGSSGAGGTGGAGVSTYSSWGSATNTGQLVSSTYYYAGGGGGGSSAGSGTYAGGNGGGGAGTGSGTVDATAGTANTGGGGGGGGTTSGVANSNGAAGGSGIVIIRYAMV